MQIRIKSTRSSAFFYVLNLLKDWLLDFQRTIRTLFLSQLRQKKSNPDFVDRDLGWWQEGLSSRVADPGRVGLDPTLTPGYGPTMKTESGSGSDPQKTSGSDLIIFTLTCFINIKVNIFDMTLLDYNFNQWKKYTDKFKSDMIGFWIWIFRPDPNFILLLTR